jgi:hypothetical protein
VQVSRRCKLLLTRELIVLGQPVDGCWKYFAEEDVLGWADGLMGNIGIEPWQDTTVTPDVIRYAKHDVAVEEFLKEKFGETTPSPVTLEHWVSTDGLKISLQIPETDLTVSGVFADSWVSSPVALAQEVFKRICATAVHRICGGTMIQEHELPLCLRGMELKFTRNICLYK